MSPRWRPPGSKRTTATRTTRCSASTTSGREAWGVCMRVRMRASGADNSAFSSASLVETDKVSIVTARLWYRASAAGTTPRTSSRCPWSWRCCQGTACPPPPPAARRSSGWARVPPPGAAPWPATRPPAAEAPPPQKLNRCHCDSAPAARGPRPTARPAPDALPIHFEVSILLCCSLSPSFDALIVAMHCIIKSLVDTTLSFKFCLSVRCCADRQLLASRHAACKRQEISRATAGCMRVNMSLPSAQPGSGPNPSGAPGQARRSTCPPGRLTGRGCAGRCCTAPT